MEDFKIVEKLIIDITLKKARFKFAIDCLHNVMQINPKKNFAFSPHCLYEGLRLTYFIATDAIEERLESILYLDSYKGTLIDYYRRRIIDPYKIQIKDEFTCWIKHQKSLKHHSALECLNIFDDPIETLNSINIRIKKAVGNYIREPVKLHVRRDINFIAMTTHCFKVQNLPISTTASEKQKRKSFFCQKLRMHVSKFPYENYTMSLFVLLPASSISNKWMIKKDITNADISALIQRLTTKKGMRMLWNLLHDNMSSEDNTDLLTWPIFEMEKDLEIRDLLQVLGAEDLLKVEAIDVDNGFTCFKASVRPGNVVHRSRVKVTEENIAAGAITLIYSGQEHSSNRIKYRKVNYNHPFVWLIYDRLNQSIDFVGAFNKFAKPDS